ncbi:unnamed protein product [Ascophyllum nodosum]
MRGIVAFVSAACATTSLFLGLTPKVDANRISIKFTIYERQTDEGPRHSPLLPVGEEEEGYPSRMVLFNNGLYGSETGLIEEDPHELIGYNQGHCVETVASEGLIAECYFTYVFDDGSLTANGPLNYDADAEGLLPTTLAVTGGTGEYFAAQGQTGLSAGPAVNFTSLRFDFELKKSP